MDKLGKLSKYKWSIEHFDGRPAFIEMAGSGFTRRLYNSKIPINPVVACYYSNEGGDWLSLLSSQEDIGKKVIGQFMKDSSYINNLYLTWLNNFELLLERYCKSFKEDIKKLSDADLLKWVRAFHDLYRKVTMPGFIDGFMFYADKRFNYLIKQFCEKNEIKNYPRIFSVLSAPVDPSFINEEENELRKIAMEVKREGFNSKISIKNFLKKDNNYKLSKVINNHLFKYSWIKSSYVGYKKYLVDDLGKNIIEILKSKKRVNGKILKQHKIEKNKLIKRYEFTPEILAISKLTELLIKWQDQRKIYTLTFVTLQSKILKEFARRTKINYDLLTYTNISELKKILNENFKVNELKVRRKYCLFIYEKGKISNIVTGRKAKLFLDKISKVKIYGIKEITGFAASLGKVTGRVKIVMSSKYISKVKKGDILVAPMTRPEHLAGMKKAVAIVTDDGGITCHAAIIARELRIPCIIGTRIATKILKDGDLVEVDANKGLIKIIKRLKNNK